MRKHFQFQLLCVFTLILIKSSGLTYVEALPSTTRFTLTNEDLKSNPSDNLKTIDTLNSSPKLVLENQSDLKYECQGGKIYKILMSEDLPKYKEEVECIFHAGFPPSKIPLGPLHGKLISVVNIQIFNNIFSKVWAGKFSYEIKCNGSLIHLGWNRFLNDANVPFVGSIGQHSRKLHLHPQEYVDGQDSFLLDYVPDFYKICPDYKSFINENKDKFPVKRAPWNKNFFPVNQLVDVARVVGRQEDGGLIFLGRMYYRDIFQKDIKSYNYAYFSIVSYDQEVNPEFKIGQNLQPLVSAAKESFKFRVHSLKDGILALLPIDNIFQMSPVKLFKRVVLQAAMSCRNLGNFLIDFLLGVGSSDNRNLDLKFQYSLPGFKSMHNGSEFMNTLELPSHNKFSHPHTTEL